MSFAATVETAYAKLNLALHVRSRSADGYHRIETIFAFCTDGDILAVGEEGGLPLTIEGPFAEGLSAGSDNLVLRAALGLSKLADIAVPPLRLIKRLPVASGIGGGSADAAAVIRLLCRLHRLQTNDPQLMTLAASLGADVPACLMSRPVRGTDRGDHLARIEDDELAGLPVLLVNPRQPLATGPVFAGWDGVDRGSLSDGPPLAAALAGRNDLEGPAVRLRPVIADVIAALARQPGCRLARMSGSGATCFALFDTIRDRDTAAMKLAALFTTCWLLPTRLREHA